MSGIEKLVGIFRIYRFGGHCIAFQDDKEVLILTSYIYFLRFFIILLVKGCQLTVLSEVAEQKLQRGTVTVKLCFCIRDI